MMLRRDFIIPALIGLGIYAQSNEVNLANNTTILILLYVILEERLGDSGDDNHSFRRGREFQQRVDEERFYRSRCL
jgi:hypothetical protein